jgi:hypothetical protein
MTYDILSRALALGHRRGLPIAEFSSPFESRFSDNLFEDTGSIYSAANLVRDPCLRAARSKFALT